MTSTHYAAYRSNEEAGVKLSDRAVDAAREVTEGIVEEALDAALEAACTVTVDASAALFEGVGGMVASVVIEAVCLFFKALLFVLCCLF